MSAFICGPDHFKALALFATSRGSFGVRVDPRYIKRLESAAGVPRLKLANLYADVLYQENVRSVATRYPNDTRDNLPGPCADAGHVTITGRDECSAKLRLAPVAILKMCDCLEYQSCETDDYRQTVAFELLDRIRGAAISALPGYEDAPWDYYAEENVGA